MVTEAEPWVVGHVLSRAAYPELTFEPSNWRVECRPCSDASGHEAVVEKIERRVFSQASTAGKSSHVPTSPPGPQNGVLEVPERLLWAPERLAAYEWLLPLLDVPENASPPLAMTLPHPDAVGSYGAEAVEWVERTQRITLRWWQRLAVARQLEHDAAGRLLWRVVVESAPRRAGKSVRIRAVALWRLEHGADLFTEPQLALHTGKDVAIVREIQRAAWRWAEEVAMWTVTRANGKEALETASGDRWLARAMHSVYGYDVCLGMVDEGWGVDPAAVDEGLEPAMLERRSPQLHLTSTAHRRATSLMRRRINDAVTSDDGETLLLLWAARPGSDVSDPETWRAASPHWTEDRRKTIASRYEKAVQGETDPEADDLDPMAGFTAQYLNQWVLKPSAAVVGTPVVEDEAWAALVASLSAEEPSSVAVEGWPGQGLSVARGWRLDDGRVLVATEDVPDVPSAAALVQVWGCSRVLVGASMADDPAWSGMTVEPETMAVRTAVSDLARLLSDGVLRHDGGAHLGGQVLGLRTSPGADGLRLRSTGRADAVKAAVWAAQAARTKQTYSWGAY